MRPWTSIWIKTKETIDEFKDSNWVRGQGLLLYLIFGINAAGESDALRRDLFSLFLFAFIFAILLRVMWVNLTFYFGKIWKGQATKRNIDTVIALSLIPEIFKLLSLIISFITADKLGDVKINYTIIIICALLTFRIFIIGLSRVQKFGYGISILNIVVPQIALWLLYFSIRGL